MLTPKETLRLGKLLEKQKEPYIRLTDGDILEIKTRCETLTGAQSNLDGFKEHMEAWNKWSAQIHTLQADNVRLLQEIEYMKSCDNAKEKTP